MKSLVAFSNRLSNIRPQSMLKEKNNRPNFNGKTFQSPHFQVILFFSSACYLIYNGLLTVPLIS